MRGKFHDVLSGIGIRRPEYGSHYFIEHILPIGHNPVMGRMARRSGQFRLSGEYAVRNRKCFEAAETCYRYRAYPGGGG